MNAEANIRFQLSSSKLAHQEDLQKGKPMALITIFIWKIYFSLKCYANV